MTGESIEYSAYQDSVRSSLSNISSQSHDISNIDVRITLFLHVCAWCLFVVGLVTSLSASFTRWRSSNRDRRAADSNSVVSDQSLLSAVSDTQPTAQYSADPQTDDCNTSVIAATPKMMRKRRAGNEVQPFSASKKLVMLLSDLSLFAAVAL